MPLLKNHSQGTTSNLSSQGTILREPKRRVLCKCKESSKQGGQIFEHLNLNSITQAVKTLSQPPAPPTLLISSPHKTLAGGGPQKDPSQGLYITPKTLGKTRGGQQVVQSKERQEEEKTEDPWNRSMPPSPGQGPLTLPRKCLR